MASEALKITNELREKYLAMLVDFFEKQGDDTCVISSGAFMLPCVDSIGNDRWVRIVVEVPSKANEEDGTDGYSLRDAYKLKVENKAKKAEDSKKKAEADKAKREAKKLKAESSAD